MSADNAYAVELKGVSFKRGARSIFNNVDIRIPRGKVTGIMGPSGCGKTTLLRLMGAQLRPASGEVWVNGQNLPTLSRSDLFDARKHMGVLFQSGALFTDLDVFENVAFPLRVHTELPEEMIRDIVLLKLQAVGLRGAIELMPDELSGGMKRRVALARAIARSADSHVRRTVRRRGSDRHGRAGPPDPSAQRCAGHHQYRGVARSGRDREHRRLPLYSR